jgi:hypothetical protein
MTDPHPTHDFEHTHAHLNYSNTNASTNLISPAISISSVSDGSFTGANAGVANSGSTNGVKFVSGHPSGLRATNHPSGIARKASYSTPPNPDAGPADTASPCPEVRSAFLSDTLEQPIVKKPDSNDYQEARHPTDADLASAFPIGGASFGSQPWTTPSAPVLDFAPRISYEPTGELIHEDVHSFEAFDVPYDTNRQPLSTIDLGHPPPSSFEISAGTSATNGPSSVATSVPSGLPRSALKRKTSSVTATPPETSVDKKVRLLSASEIQSGKDTNPVHGRSVTFERMSNIGPTSPDDGSITSELAGSRAAAGLAAGNRRTRQSSNSTARPPILPSNSSQGSFRRGTRTSSAHPPSILPPEKVFPIQIGSDLFRLSGASISSDGKSCSEGGRSR